MKNEFTTNSYEETRQLGKLLAKEVQGGEIICLSGDLGAGKTTFAQGFLEEIGADGPYTSPTFAIMKEYKITDAKKTPQNIYHIDAYRISASDMLDLGWKDFAGKNNCITIVEWAEKIKTIVPAGSLWIQFEWIDENKRKISIS